MKRSLLFSLLVIAAIVALTVAGTLAYFTGTKDESGSLTTATISVGDTTGFPLSYSLMLPGESQTKTVTVTNSSDRAADLYVQLQTASADVDFCNPDAGVNLKIEGGGTWYNDNICKLYPGWPGSLIVKIADDVAPGGTVTRDATITLPSDLPGDDSAYEGKTVNNTVHLIAIQYNGPAPIADKDSGTLFPADGGSDDDPYYP